MNFKKKIVSDQDVFPSLISRGWQMQSPTSQSHISYTSGPRAGLHYAWPSLACKLSGHVSPLVLSFIFSSFDLEYNFLDPHFVNIFLILVLQITHFFNFSFLRVLGYQKSHFQ